MEIVIPLLTLGSIYIASIQKKTPKPVDGFQGIADSKLPNVNVPDQNYNVPYQSDPIYMDTSQLSRDFRYDGGPVYTDKYFNPSSDPTRSTFSDNKPVEQKVFTALTGEKVDSSYFQHNNMIPFFGGTLRTRHVADNSNESILDNMIGTGKQQIRKTERSPLFSPQANYNYIHGVPNQSDFLQERVVASNKISNVQPFEQIKVGPGIGGDGISGMGGFNAGQLSREQWIDKNVDQLRVANKPKMGGVSALGYEGHGSFFIKTMGEQGIQEKNRVTTSWEQGADRWLTTTGVEKGPQLVPIPMPKNVSRPETSTSYSGIAKGESSSEYVIGEYMPSHKQELGSYPLQPAYSSGIAGGREGEYGMDSTKAYTNNRSFGQNNSDTYFGLAGGFIHETVAPLLDILKDTRKQTTVKNARPYQNPKTSVANSYIVNTNDRPSATIRDTYEQKIHLQVNAGQHSDGYRTTTYTPIENQRLTTDNYSYIGGGSAYTGQKPTSNYSSYNQVNNSGLSSVIENSGRLQQGGMSLYNATINQSNNELKQTQLINNRVPVATMPNTVADKDTFTKFNKNGQTLYQGQSLDRNDSYVLSQLKNNPFALSINGK